MRYIMKDEVYDIAYIIMFFFAYRRMGPRPRQVANAVTPTITTVAKSAWIFIF
jgi:hypothetical protein